MSESNPAAEQTAPTSQSTIPVSDLIEIAKDFQQTKTIYFSASGEVVEKPGSEGKQYQWKRTGGRALEIRALDDDELAEADEITSSLIPPFKKAKDGTVLRPGEEQERDWYDPDYTKRLRDANRKRRDKVIITGLVKPEIPGAKYDDKVLFLHKLPKRLLDLLAREIEAISGGMLPALELANFTSGAD